MVSCTWGTELQRKGLEWFLPADATQTPGPYPPATSELVKGSESDLDCLVILLFGVGTLYGCDVALWWLWVLIWALFSAEWWHQIDENSDAEGKPAVLGSNALDLHPSVVVALVLSLEGWIHSFPWLVAFQFALRSWATHSSSVPEAILNGESLSYSPKKILSFQTSKASAFSNTRWMWIHWFHRLLLFLSFVLSLSDLSFPLSLSDFSCFYLRPIQTSLFCNLEGRWTQIQLGIWEEAPCVALGIFLWKHLLNISW